MLLTSQRIRKKDFFQNNTTVYDVQKGTQCLLREN